MVKVGNYLVAYRIDETNSYVLENITTRQLIVCSYHVIARLKEAIRRGSGDFLFENEDVMVGLQAGGFLIPEEVNELDLIRMEEMRNRFGYPWFMQLWLAVTDACNMACRYCAQGHISRGKVMSKTVQDGVVKFLARRFPTKEFASFCWYGGEPLLEANIIAGLGSRIEELAEFNRVKTSHRIITNGTLLNDKTVGILQKLKIQSVQVTMDTTAEYHDRMRTFPGGEPSWQVIMSKVKEYNHVIPIRIRVNLTSSNHLSLGRFLRVLDENQVLDKVEIDLAMVSCFEGFSYVDNFKFDESQELDRSKFEDILIRLIENECYGKKLRAQRFKSVIIPTNFSQCQAKRPDSFVVGPSGELYKCAVALGDPNGVVGNILEARFPDPMLHSRYLGFDASHDSNCVDCLVYPACRGGCLISRIVSESNKAKCFISAPRWFKTLRLRLSDTLGVVIESFAAVNLYPRERRLGVVLLPPANLPNT